MKPFVTIDAGMYKPPLPDSEGEAEDLQQGQEEQEQIEEEHDEGIYIFIICNKQSFSVLKFNLLKVLKQIMKMMRTRMLMKRKLKKNNLRKINMSLMMTKPRNW